MDSSQPIPVQQSSETPSQPNFPLSPPSSPAPRFLLFLIIGGLVLLLAGLTGGIFLNKNILIFKIIPTPSVPSHPSSPLYSSSPTTPLFPLSAPSQDETSGWKIYIDPVGRFSVKWKEGWYEPAIEVVKKAPILSLKTWLISEDERERQDRLCYNCFNVFSEKEIKMDGHTAIIREVASHPAGRTFRAYISINDEEIAYLNVCCGDPEKPWNDYVSLEEVNKQFNQILSTLKFLDNTNTTVPTPTINDSTEGKFCGGIAANLPENQCPEGYHCQLDGNYPDAGGICVKN